MAVLDSKGGLFGAFTTEPWHVSARNRCYGGGDSFVFSLKRKGIGRNAAYHWTKANSLFQTGTLICTVLLSGVNRANIHYVGC